MNGVSPTIEDAARAIGLFGSDGNVSKDWFTNPLAPLGNILTNPIQRTALLDLLDQLWPPENPPGTPANEKWHPLLGSQERGNLYLTVANGTGPLKIGFAGEVHSTASPLAASLHGQLPIVLVKDSGATVIAGTADGPFEAEIRVELNWAISKGQAIDLKAIRATVVLQPLATPPAILHIVLEGLRLDGTGSPQDTDLDPQRLGPQAFQLVTGLLREKLRQIAGTAAGEAGALANHLMPLLGLADGFPAFPFATLTTDPAAFRNWIAAIGSSGKIGDWLGNLGAIFGGDAVATQTGNETSVRIFSIDTNSPVEVTLTQVTEAHSGTRRLDIGLRATYIPGGANPPARIDASAVIASIPLAGGTTAAVLPSASITVASPAKATDTLVATAGVTVHSVRAGAEWNGTAIAPLLELDDVTLTLGGATNHYDHIDLTNTDSVAGFASDAVANTIRAALGASGPGAHLAALAGLAKPAGDPGWTHLVDTASLVAHPTSAIAAVHRAALVDAVHKWSFLLPELGGLMGLTGAVSGTGTKDNPWRVPLAPGAISIDLAAWNAQESHNAADPQLLRLGLRASAGTSPWKFWWLAELLAVDLPQSGSGNVSLMAGQHAAFVLDPAPTSPATAGISIKAASAAFEMDWTPGGSMEMHAVVSNLAVTAGATTANIPSLVFPPPAGFDIANPAPTLGVPLADLEMLFRLLFSRALFAWADMQGAALSGLLGLNGNLAGLQSDWPALGGNFFSDPLGSLRAWLGRVAVEVSSDGSPFLPNALAWLAGLVNGSLPKSLTEGPPDPINGAGIYEDPWVLPVDAGTDLIAWLEPAGPPTSWISGLPAAIGATNFFSDLIDVAYRVGAFVPHVREALAKNDPAMLSDTLDTLSAWFAASDGFVPVTSQVPNGGTWTAGTPINSAHTAQPSDASAISQINAQIAAWNPGPKAVLLLGPAFSDHTIWNDLLAPIASKPNFNLRIPGVDPSVVDLRSVTEAADYYTADLQENGLARVSAQIARLVARIGELRPGAIVTLVAHSTAGVAARAFTQANPALVRGLITLGSPHLGSSLFPVLDPAGGTALRALREMTPSLAAGPIADAMQALELAADGYLPAAGPGKIPTPAPFPFAAFTAPGTTDTAGIPALAIGGTLSGDLFTEVRQALSTIASSAAGGAKPVPTHLAFGCRAPLDFGSAGDVGLDVHLRVDAFRVALNSGAAEPPRSAHALTVEMALTSVSGWLAGSPSADVRVRWAELGLYLASGVAVPRALLHDAAFHSPSIGVVDLTHPQAQALLGAVFQSIASPTPTAATALGGLLNALGSLGVTTPDPHGGIGISADAFSAISLDPAGYLKPRLKAALDTGLAGFSGPGGGPYKLSLGTTPFELYIDGATAGIRTTTPLAIGQLGSATLDARASFPAVSAALDLSFTLGAATIAYTQSTGKLVFSAKPWVDSLPLPPTASDLSAAMNRAIPRLLLSSAVSALIEATIGPGFTISALDPFLESPGPSTQSSKALGSGSCLDVAKITGFLQGIASAAGFAPGPGVLLPGNLLLTATGSGPIGLNLATTSPIGGALDVQLTANIDCSMHVTPAGTLKLHTPLPGTWPSVIITFSVDESGVSLDVAPQTTPPLTIQLLPKFSGLGSLAGAVQALLPQALDALVDALSPSTIRDAALEVAAAFDLYDAAGKFTGHAAQLRALTDGNWSASVSAAMRTTVIPRIQALLGAITGSVATSANKVTIGAGGPFGISLGWDSAPSLALNASGLKLPNGALSADFDVGYVGGAIVATVTMGVHFQSSIGVTVVPQVLIAYTGGKFQVTLLPLGEALQSTLNIVLAPTPAVNGSSDAPAELAKQWLLPVAADLVVGAAKPQFASSIWPLGPNLQDLLTAAGLLTAGVLTSPLPDIKSIVTGLITGLASHAAITIGNFKVTFVSDSTGLGVNLRGFQDISLGDVGLSLRFDNLDVPSPSQGVTIYIFRNPADFSVNPKLSVAGLGVEFTGPGGGPLINSSSFRMEGAGGFLYFDFDGGVKDLGGAIEAKGIGLPLNQLGGANNGGNPVASSLLEGAGSNNGDPHPVNPAVDVLAFHVNGATGVHIGAPAPPLWLGVHRSFGPIYIEQIGVEWTNDSAGLLVDGTVKVAALTVQAYELSLDFKFKDLLSPDQWTLDLQGLAVAFQSGPVSIAGGLLKNPGPPAVEYDGMLSCDIAGRGFTVVGGYSRPKDGQGDYTSLFIFVSLPIPLGGPPFLFVTGLGGGAGYNRELQPPTDLNQLPSFFLISAIDDDDLANNPMGALVSMVKYVPPRRGSFWLAAGVRFNSFVVVNSVAVVYVALDRGFEVAILGVSHMQLPAPGIELVSIELALKVRFSTAEGVFSIQAQLTDNSWLFSQDCQLTGGFAFFIWFTEGHFVLTIGGYHPAFQKPPEFPLVPRLGFHWQVLGFVQIKGEAYFAISSSAFMCGGRLEASAGFGGIRAWFTIHADFLIQWDPFHYDFQVGVEVGVSLTIEVCFFGCVSVSITISKGADVHVFGPPFHADLTFDAYVTSITLSFGGDPTPRPDPLHWDRFRDKYLISGNPENTWVGVRVVQGLIQPDPPGGQPSPGSESQPWKLSPELAFLTESRMPVSGYVAGGVFDAQGAVIQLPFKTLPDSQLYDLAAMDTLKVGSKHTIAFSPPVTHPNQFLVEEIRTWLPEASWRWYDPAHLPAAANRINAITGLRITAVAVLQGKSALIPVSTLVDDDPRYAQPLPFETVFAVVGSLVIYGAAAEALAGITATANSKKTLAAATQVLAGNGFFSAARRVVGLPSAGIPPLAVNALAKRRSSPPLLTPLSTGLSMKPVALNPPPAFLRVRPVSPVVLEKPRLRAVLQSPIRPVTDAPPSVRTTARKVSAPDAPRMAPPRLKITPGARLDRIAAPNAPRSTAPSFTARALHNSELSALTGTEHTGNFDSAGAALSNKGVTVPAGTTHIWEIPTPTVSFDLVGNAAVRITSMNRAGQVLGDVEIVVNGEARIAAVAGCESVSITCLGVVPSSLSQLAPAFGAITFAVASTGNVPAVGWQAGNVFPQAGPSNILARGAALILRKAYITAANRQKTTQGMALISDAVAAQSGVETWLPKAIGVVMILLDQQDQTAVDAGDLAIACDGATLATPPVAGTGGRRRTLLYDVVATDEKAEHISVSVLSKTGWRLAGVVGLPGRAVEWAARLHGDVPPHLVPDGPLTSGGEVLVRLAAGQGGSR